MGGVMGGVVGFSPTGGVMGGVVGFSPTGGVMGGVVGFSPTGGAVTGGVVASTRNKKKKRKRDLEKSEKASSKTLRGQIFLTSTSTFQLDYERLFCTRQRVGEKRVVIV
jgi:hypothetical protein